MSKIFSSLSLSSLSLSPLSPSSLSPLSSSLSSSSLSPLSSLSSPLSSQTPSLLFSPSPSSLSPLSLSSSSLSPSLSSRSLWTSFPLKNEHPGLHQTPIVKKLWETREKVEQENNERTPSFSETSVTYDFEKTPGIRDRYMNPWGLIRMGRVLEDLDALAGTIAHKHCCEADGTLKQQLVTAAVDRIQVRHRANLRDDMTLHGKVAHTGKSSLEIRMWVTSSWTTIPWLNANFVFVARDPETGKAASIPPLVITNEKEREMFDSLEAARQRAKEMRALRKGDNPLSLFGLEAPSQESAILASKLLKESRPLSLLPASPRSDVVLISHTETSNLIICHHQNRNIHGRVFGGFLMRQAFELSFITAYQFLEAQPVFIEVDKVDFRKPVDVGDVLHFNACVLYTSESKENPESPNKEGGYPKVHIEVTADIMRPEKQEAERSNIFHFTFECRKKERVKRVLPGTVEEAVRVAHLMELNQEQERFEK